jgi:hypothetical protein
MAKTDHEVKLYMKHRISQTQEMSAAKAGMTAKTGRKYEQSGKLPSKHKKKRGYATRVDPFMQHEEYIKQMYIATPKLQTKTILNHLIATFPTANYGLSQLRTLSRRLRPLRVVYGCSKEMFFPQELTPGIESQSDWTHMDSLNITITGQRFKHYLFHFMLPYSCWESVDICYSESFDSLASGYNKACFELGGVLPHHKTDNSSTATKKAQLGRAYTGRYAGLLEHYGVMARRNNPGKGHENGSVEKSHDLFKNAVEQALLLRGSREFMTIEDYREFLELLTAQRNQERIIKTNKELQLLKPLPSKAYEYLELKEVRVNKFGLVRIKGSNYSVPTEYIGNKLDSVIGGTDIRLYFADALIVVMPKVTDTTKVNYLHVIDSLIKKPGAFKNYKYRECLYPQPVYKQSYELLELSSANYVKEYLNVLYLAKHYGEGIVTTQLQLLINSGELVQSIKTGAFEKQIKEGLTMRLPPRNEEVKSSALATYNGLLSGGATCN